MSLFFHRLDDKNYYELPRLGGYLKSVYACVCPLSLRNSERTRWFTQITPDEHPRRHVLADGLLSSLYAPSLSLSSFGAASVMMFCSACPASSGVLSVVPEDRIGRNIMYVGRFCYRINVHVVDHARIVWKLGWRSTTGPPDRLSSSLVPVSPPDATANTVASSNHFAPLCQV